MRNIQYRALAKDGTWRYGAYPMVSPEMSNTIYPMDIFWKNFLSSFRRETLGAWTGLSDKNGIRIYEGDIVEHLKYGGTYQVVYSAKNTGYDLERDNKSMHLGSGCCPNLVVIGNSYQDSEFLREVKHD